MDFRNDGQYIDMFGVNVPIFMFIEGPCRNLSTNDYNRRMPGARGGFVCVSYDYSSYANVYELHVLVFAT